MKNSATKGKFDFILPFGILCVFVTGSCNRSNFGHSAQDTGFSQNGQVPKSDEQASQFELTENFPVYRKNNLETLSIGRNRIEIEQMMGPPEGRSLDGGNGYLWDYRRPVYDEASETVYGWSLVSFKFLKGLCAYVNVRLENPPVQLLQDPDDGK